MVNPGAAALAGLEGSNHGFHNLDLRVQVGAMTAPVELSTAEQHLADTRGLLLKSAYLARSAGNHTLCIRLGAQAAECEKLADDLQQAVRNYTDTESRNQGLAGFMIDAINWITEGMTSRYVLPLERTAARAGLGLVLDGTVMGLAYLFGDRRFAFNLLSHVVETGDELLLGRSVASDRTSIDRPAQLLNRIIPRTDVDALRHRLQLDGTPSARVTAPAGISDLARRLPQGAEQVRIEEYHDADGPAYVVYVKGTDFGGDQHEPWNAMSNLPAVAGQVAASQAAAEEAMRRQGIRPGDRVLFVGHSQGALVAERIADTRTYRVAEVVTFGGPLGTEHPSAQTLALAHDDDPVPSLAGVQEATDNAVIVRSKAPGLADNPGVFDPHDMSAYQRTAVKVDACAERNIAEKVDIVRNFARGEGIDKLWKARLN